MFCPKCVPNGPLGVASTLASGARATGEEPSPPPCSHSSWALIICLYEDRLKFKPIVMALVVTNMKQNLCFHDKPLDTPSSYWGPAIKWLKFWRLNTFSRGLYLYEEVFRYQNDQPFDCRPSVWRSIERLVVKTQVLFHISYYQGHDCGLKFQSMSLTLICKSI